MDMEPGWLNRQIKSLDESIKSWPEFMKREAGLGSPHLSNVTGAFFLSDPAYVPDPYRPKSESVIENLALQFLNTRDWQEAFDVCGKPNAATPSSDVSTELFSRKDVIGMLGVREGANDGPNWLLAGVLKDGRWFMLDAGCDYTGWDCQAGGTATVARTRDELIRFGMSSEHRRVFGLELPDLD